MRHRAILIILTFVALQTVSPATDSRDPAVTLYDPNPAHIWNRLHAVLLLRVDANGVNYGSDSLDPLLWQNSTYLLAQPSALVGKRRHDLVEAAALRLGFAKRILGGK